MNAEQLGHDRSGTASKRPRLFIIQRSAFILFFFFAWLAAALALSLAGPPRCDVGAEEDIGCARGFETRERAAGRSFRWTDGASAIRLHAAGYGAPLVAEVTLAAPRLAGAPPTSVTLAAGRASASFPADATPRRYMLLLPATFPAGDIATIDVLSDAQQPPRDQRRLGVQVFDARLRAPPGPRLPGPLHALGLLGVGLALACLTDRQFGGHRPPEDIRLEGMRPSRPLRASGLLAIALIAALWAWLPARVAPFLPGLALALGAAALALRAVPGFSGETRTATLPLSAGGRGGWGVRGPVALAVLASAALDAAFAAGVLRGPWLSAGVLAQAALTLSAVWRAGSHPISLAGLLGVALAVRLLGMAARLLTGGAAGDPDVELFYSYGRATIELGLPVTEYPSGALVPWALLALPASRELFALLLPLLNTLCDLGVVYALYSIAAGARMSAADGHVAQTFSLPGRAGNAFGVQPSAFSLFYALSPLLLPFWHGKFDSLPAALLLLGLAAFLARRPLLAGALLGLGGAIKWAPWLAAPPLALYLIRSGRKHEDTRTRGHEGEQVATASSAPYKREHSHVSTAPSGPGYEGFFVPARLRACVFLPALLRFATGGLLAVAAASLPFALRDGAAFLAPYTFQSGRPLIGESLWFLPAALLDPGLVAALTHPWSNVARSPIAPALTVVAQALALAALALPVLVRPSDPRRALALAALAPAAFLLLNRIFSPQYLLVITAAALAAGGAVLRGREALALVALLTLAQAANLLVWPYTSSAWLLASAALFAAALTALAWLAVRAARR